MITIKYPIFFDGISKLRFVCGERKLCSALGDVGFVSSSELIISYIGPKGYYHFNELLNLDSEELDVYGGISILYRNFRVVDGIFGINASGIYPGFHIGGRYYFSENLGAYAELGNSYGWLKVGVCLKL